MMPLEKRGWVPGLQWAGHLVLWKKTSLGGTHVPLWISSWPFPLRSYFFSREGWGKREPGALSQPSLIGYFLFVSWPRLSARIGLEFLLSWGFREGAPRMSVPDASGGTGRGKELIPSTHRAAGWAWKPSSTAWPSSSDGRGLLDTVEADTGRGGGDGHGAGHAGADRVLVLPAVPPLPDGRADLWAQSRAPCPSPGLEPPPLPSGRRKQVYP